MPNQHPVALQSSAVHYSPNLDPAHLHHMKFSLNTDILCWLILANSFCFLRIFSPQHSHLQRRTKKKKREERKIPEFSFLLPKSYIFKWRTAMRHVLPTVTSPHCAGHSCRDDLPLFWIFTWVVPFQEAHHTKVPSPPFKRWITRS